MWQNENEGPVSSAFGKRSPWLTHAAKVKLSTHKDIKNKRRESNSDITKTHLSSTTTTQCSTSRDMAIVENVEKIIDIVSQYPFDKNDRNVDDIQATADDVQAVSKNCNGTSRLDHLVRTRLKQLRDMRAIAIANVANPPVLTKSCTLRKNNLLCKYAKRPIVNVSNAKFDASLLSECLTSLKWKGCNYGGVGDVHWCGGPLNIQDFSKLVETSEPMSYKSIVVNRYPNMHDITKKRQFSEWLRCCEKYRQYYSGNIYSCSNLNFYPPSFMLPRERCKVERLLKAGRPVILKPSAGSLGVGVKIIIDADDFEPASMYNNDYIAQEYITEPALLNGKKFDIRLYLLMTNVCGGSKALLSKHAMVRVCTESYNSPTKCNANNHFMHLTNYSINRLNNGKYYRHKSDVTDVKNNKRPLFLVLDQLACEGYDKFDIWRQMVSISESVASAIYPQADIHRRYITKPVRCFQILGLDVIIDLSGKVWLLEANANPSLQITYMDGHLMKRDAVDFHVKFPLVKCTLDLVHKYSMDGDDVGLDLDSDWQHLDVNVPPEIINYLHYYIHCKGTKKGSRVWRCESGLNVFGITKFEWLSFCNRNGLLTIANSIAAAGGRGLTSGSGGKVLLERLYDRINGLEGGSNGKSEVNLLSFIKLMEAFACMAYGDSFEDFNANNVAEPFGNKAINVNEDACDCKFNGEKFWGCLEYGADCMWDGFVVESTRNLCDYLDAYIFPF